MFLSQRRAGVSDVRESLSLRGKNGSGSEGFRGQRGLGFREAHRVQSRSGVRVLQELKSFGSLIRSGVRGSGVREAQGSETIRGQSRSGARVVQES